MSNFHFITNPVDLVSQTEEQAFGEKITSNGLERFNLENSFSVSQNAPLYAITKSAVIYFENAMNSDVLNVALMPFNSNNLGGFPIKFFVFRGIDRNSLLDTNNNIVTSDSSWSTSNILDIAKDIQDRINNETNGNLIANSDALGIQFSSENDTTLIESLFKNNVDDFHPLIVPSGCQLGKLTGGSETLGASIILDKVGQDATFELLKKDSNLLEIPELNIPPGSTSKEELKLKFLNRAKKEKVLSFMDITAFFGACENQGIKISGVSDTSYLNSFYNKESIYIDIRSKNGDSFNHYFDVNDTIQLGFYNSSNEIVFQDINYYESWPLLCLKNLSYASQKQSFFIKIPIIAGAPERNNFVKSYHKKVFLNDKNNTSRYFEVGGQSKDSIKLQWTENIEIENFILSNNSLGSNHILFKLDSLLIRDQKNVGNSVFSSFFRLNMTPLYPYNSINDGEFFVKTYASINTPLLKSDDNKKIYQPKMGIAFDKHRVTFFSYREEVVKGNINSTQIISQTYIESGKYKSTYNQNEISPSSNDESVGFLWQFVNSLSSKIKGIELKQVEYINPFDGNSNSNSLMYVINNAKAVEENFLEDFYAICLEYEEYEALINLQGVSLTDNDYITTDTEDFFIASSGERQSIEENLLLVEKEISLSVPKLFENNGEAYISLASYPEEILVSNDPITINSAINI